MYDITMEIRRYKNEDAKEISALVCRNFIEVNSKDYPLSEMQSLAKEYNAEKIRNIASYAHMYVACEGKTIIGTGSISSYWGSETESILLTIFVLPEYHGQTPDEKLLRHWSKMNYFCVQSA